MKDIKEEKIKGKRDLMKFDANEERYDGREIYCVKKERYTGKETVWKKQIQDDMYIIWNRRDM